MEIVTASAYCGDMPAAPAFEPMNSAADEYLIALGILADTAWTPEQHEIVTQAVRGLRDALVAAKGAQDLKERLALSVSETWVERDRHIERRTTGTGWDPAEVA